MDAPRARAVHRDPQRRARCRSRLAGGPRVARGDGRHPPGQGAPRVDQDLASRSRRRQATASEGPPLACTRSRSRRKASGISTDCPRRYELRSSRRSWARIAENPQRAGKPLRGELEGLYSARRGEFRGSTRSMRQPTPCWCTALSTGVASTGLADVTVNQGKDKPATRRNAVDVRDVAVVTATHGQVVGPHAAGADAAVDHVIRSADLLPVLRLTTWIPWYPHGCRG